jgi:RND family efflux transporter MFP subunit
MKTGSQRYALILFFTLLAVSISGCRSGSAERTAGGRPGGGPNAAPPMETRRVQMVPVMERSLARLVTAPGTLAADEQISLAFKVAGRISKINIDLGSDVRRGQIIAELETEDFKVRVAQAEAALQQARVRLGLPPEATDDPNDDRISVENTALVRQAQAVLEEAKLNRDRAAQLVKQGLQAQAELDRTESALKVADSRYQDAIEEVRNRQAVLAQRRSELTLARQQLSYTVLYAPSEGAVREKRTSVGEFLAAGAPVATVMRLHPLRLRVEIPERDAQGVRSGLPVGVTVEGDVEKFSGRVVRLSPAIEEQSRTLIVEAEVDNQRGRLRPGAFAKAEIQTSTSQGAITVPASAVVTFAGIQKVFLAKDGKAVERQVILGKREADWVEITEGLKPGEMVVDSPGNLVSGQPLTIQDHNP